MKKGIVTKSTGSWYYVRLENGDRIRCAVKGNFRVRGIRSTNPIAVGDKVFVEFDGNTGLISDLDDRKNYIVRKSANLSHHKHVIAANIDQAFLVITLESPKTYLRFIDRFLVTAEAYRIPVILVFNKTDIYSKNTLLKLAEWEEIYTSIGYDCLRTSAYKNINIDVLKKKLTGKVNLLAGNSGVGKSSLINKIDPHINLKTAEISDFHKKGKHTTTFAEMFELECMGFIIDTPGLKSFGMVEMDKNEIFHFYPEIFKKSHYCQYNNCIHFREPNCAVKQAVEDNKISKSRYDSYLQLLSEQDLKYREAQ